MPICPRDITYLPNTAPGMGYAGMNMTWFLAPWSSWLKKETEYTQWNEREACTSCSGSMMEVTIGMCSEWRVGVW